MTRIRGIDAVCVVIVLAIALAAIVPLLLAAAMG